MLVRSAAPTPVTRYISELQTCGGLRGTDIANIADVSKATVSRWSRGSPAPHAERILADLHYVVTRREEHYSPPEIRSWLYAPHPQLEGVRAIDAINAGDAEEVLRILTRLDARAYL